MKVDSREKNACERFTDKNFVFIENRISHRTVLDRTEMFSIGNLSFNIIICYVLDIVRHTEFERIWKKKKWLLVDYPLSQALIKWNPTQKLLHYDQSDHHHRHLQLFVSNQNRSLLSVRKEFFLFLYHLFFLYLAEIPPKFKAESTENSIRDQSSLL